MLPFLLIAGAILILGIISIASIKKKLIKKNINSFLIKEVNECKNQVTIEAMGEDIVVKGKSIDDDIYENEGKVIYV